MYKFLRNSVPTGLVVLSTSVAMTNNLQAVEVPEASTTEPATRREKIDNHEALPIQLEASLFSTTTGFDLVDANLVVATAIFGHSPAVSVAPSQNKSSIQHQYSTRAADLLSEADSSPESTTTPRQEQRPFYFPVGGANQDSSFGIGSAFGEPTALQGPTRKGIVSAGSQQTLEGFSISPYLRQRITDRQLLTLQTVLGVRELGFDVSYAIAPESLPGAFSVNFQNRRARVPVFEGGDRNVDLPHGSDPWVHRMGGGIEYYQPFTSNFSAALGLNYQRVSVRSAMFSSNIESEDERGNRVTVSNDGQDDLLTFNFAALYNTVDDWDYPTRGSRVRFGIDQSFPVGEASILFTRFSANFSQFIPLNLFKFSEGTPTLVLNFQGGTMLGDVPPYEAFTLGNSSTVRGYHKGGVGSGSSFIEATAEYRFPISSLNVFNQPVGLWGSLFVDYGSTLGTQGDVIGKPGKERDKPGDGFGYGVGVHARTRFGLFKLETALSDDGDLRVYFVSGDRF